MLYMNWQEYRKNTSIPTDGYWTDVSYGSILIPEHHPTKGFIAVDSLKITAIGHVWFQYQQLAKAHYFEFNDDSRLKSEHQPGKIILSGSIGEIDRIHLDRLIGLATDFRGKYPLFDDSLDMCVRQLKQLTRKK